MFIQGLARRFSEAGLDLALLDQPLSTGRGMETTFQMDIRRRVPHAAASEYFVVWPGHEENRVQVQGLDRSLAQLVLLVDEPARTFYEPVGAFALSSALRRHGDAWRPKLAADLGVPERDLTGSRHNLSVRRVTPAGKRHMLAGRDERQLFMCRLPSACTTVRAAHAALRAPGLALGRSAIDRPVRQGEWFFVALAGHEEAALLAAIGTQQVFVRRKAGIGSFIPRAGKPHVADELVVVPAPFSDAWRKSAQGSAEPQVYVRGAVRHPDHESVRFVHFRRVLKNREASEGARAFGGTWID